MTSIPGVDYAWSHPGGAALQKAGKKFACRYLATISPATRAKVLTRSEADDLAAHGVSSVVVWETTAGRALAGRAAGIADARTAQTQATAAGMPSGRPIYFAVDFDATEAEQAAIDAYLGGATSVLGAARVGIYGGYYPVKRALDGGHATWAWQTIAWSGNHWDPRAHIRQGAQQTINGASCDLNTAMRPDYGQWTPGQTPQLEDDMPTAKEIAAAVMEYQIDDPRTEGTHYVPLKSVLWWTGADAAQANATIKAQGAAITALAGLAGTGVDTAAVVAAVQQAIAAAVVHADVNVTVSGTTPKES